MNKQTVGTCGNCGGKVSVDTIYWSIVPPRPQCERCGSFAAEDYGPVIQMEPKPLSGASNKWYEVTVRFDTNDCVPKTTFFPITPAVNTKTTYYRTDSDTQFTSVSTLI